MDHYRPVSEETSGTRLRGGVEVQVRGLKGSGSGDLAVLAAEVAHLAGLGGGWVTRGLFAADVGVEVGERGGAVSVGGDGLVVDVIDCEIVSTDLDGWLVGRGGMGGRVEWKCMGVLMGKEDV